MIDPLPPSDGGEIRWSLLAPDLARLLGDGAGLLAEASMTQCARVEPVHVLAFLARTGGAIVRTELLERNNVGPERFCQSLYEVALDEDRPPGMPIRFAFDELSEPAQRMWRAFEEAAAERGPARGTERLLTRVLLDHVDPLVVKMLAAVAGSDDAFARFRDAPEMDRQPAGLFDPDSGRIAESALDKSGRRVLDLLREETAGLGYRKATAKHLLYALAGIENGWLQRAIQFQAIDPLREVHGYLSRELTRPGSRRTPDFAIDRSTLHESVVRILEGAAAEAQRQGLRVGELHIARALVAGRTPGIADFLTSRKVNVDVLREYLGRAEGEAEDAADSLRLPVAQIEAELRRRLLGQDHAIRKILPWIKRLRFGFPRERGPAAVLLFLGPSGTGKTQLAKELARTVYGSDDELIMLEMGQFNSKESSNLFIGAPPGYVGYGEGKLTNGLRDKPQSVVLFDEIEKAHEDVWVALLRFLDEGLISDPAGPTRDGRRCIVVLTSNLGAGTLAKRIPAAGADGSAMDHELEQAIRDEVLKYLKRPEIYNRVDDKIVFRPFSRDTYRELIARQVNGEKRKFVDLCGTRIEVQEDVLDWLAEQAYQAREEGARCIPRLANRFVVSPVIDLLTQGEETSIPQVIVSRRGEDTVVEEL